MQSLAKLFAHASPHQRARPTGALKTAKNPLEFTRRKVNYHSQRQNRSTRSLASRQSLHGGQALDRQQYCNACTPCALAARSPQMRLPRITLFVFQLWVSTANGSKLRVGVLYIYQQNYVGGDSQTRRFWREGGVTVNRPRRQTAFSKGRPLLCATEQWAKTS